MSYVKCDDLVLMCSQCRSDYFVRKKIKAKTSLQKYFRSFEIDYLENS